MRLRCTGNSVTFNPRPRRTMKKFAITGLLSAAMMTTVATAGVFSDVEPSHWAYKTLNDLHAKGIVKGDGTGKFKGGERITRYEAAMMVGEAIRYVSSVRAAGGTIDHETMDMISSIMTEMTDEMQVLEIRVEENSDAIAAMRKDLTMKGKSCQGISVPMGAGRLKIMGQAMFSLVAGGDDSTYSQVNTAGTNEGATQFLADYAALGFAADIDEKTSFYTRANVYMGGQANNNNLGGVFGKTTGIEFDDFMYIHVKELWSDWDMSLGRIAMPFGHETAGMFRTNPYFVSNSMVDYMYGFVDGAYFSSENEDGDWYYGFGIHNGNVLATPETKYSHVYTFAKPMNDPILGFNVPSMNNAGNTANRNENDDFGYMLQVGSQAQNGDLKWDLGYFTNGAGFDANAVAAGAAANQREVSFFNLGIDYRIDKDWHMTAEYVDGSIEQNATLEDDFTAWYVQVIHNLNEKSTLALRYGISEYDQAAAGAASLKDEANELTFAYARKLSDNGTMILEYSQPEIDKLAGASANIANDDYDVIRASYRIDF